MDRDPQASELLAEMAEAFLSAHGGLSAERRAETIAVPNAAFSCGVHVFLHSTPRESLVIQADFVVRAPSLGKRAIVESFGGSGETMPEAVTDVFRKFCLSCGHVLLAVFFGPERGGEQVKFETWHLPSRTMSVCLGSLLLLGSASPASHRFGSFLDLLRAKHIAGLDAGVHWIRVYYSANAQGRLGAEVLLDNEPWTAAELDLRTFPWPPAPEWYSMRNFFVVRPEGAARQERGAEDRRRA